MYQALLTRRYLTRRIMPLLSVLAVALSTAMVLTTWSVMGGFLGVLLDSGRTLVGDVKISRSNRGFPLYDELVTRLENDEMIERATGVVETFGVVSRVGDEFKAVRVLGVEPESYNAVTGSFDTLYWRPVDGTGVEESQHEDPRLRPLLPGKPELARRLELTWEQILENGRVLKRIDRRSGQRVPAMVPGIEINAQINRRQPGGWYLPLKRTENPADVDDWYLLPVHGQITLRVLPLDASGRALEMASRIMPVANEFRTGNYEFDSKLVIVPRDVLQEMMHMDRAQRVLSPGGLVVDPGTGIEHYVQPQTVAEPARVNTVLVRGVEGAPLHELRDRVEAIYQTFAIEHGLPEARVQTWEQINAQFIGAVKKEIALVLVLFSFISMTAVFLVLAIFWSMVNEKTRDIGILRSLGATRAGIAWLWLRYGLIIGLLGSALGGTLAYTIVRNINPIHEWLGRALGISIWDPKVYYFSEIPNTVKTSAAVMVLVGGTLAAALGALIPAMRAALMDPVRALRFE